MIHSTEIKEKARRLRKAHKSLDEIATDIGVSRSTIYSWVNDIHLPGRTGSQKEQLKFAQRKMQDKYAKLRQEAYDSVDVPNALGDPLIRDFIVMYLGEGFRRNRNVVEICNTNPIIMSMSLAAVEKIQPGTRPTFKLKLYPDLKDEIEKKFWGRQVGVTPSRIKVWRDSAKRSEIPHRRSEHGILYAHWGDTYLRAKIQALMDAVQNEWKSVRVAQSG